MIRETAIAVALVGLVGVGAVTPAVGAATQETPERSFVVDLQEDGSATVTVTSTYDLETENESDAFEQLRSDQQIRERFLTLFRERMGAVAANAENATGREMTVENGSIDLRTVGDTGIVELSVEWEGLAATEGDRLVVTEPVASGFTPDRPFHLVVPDGYEATSTTPSPADSSDGQLVWAAENDLEGYEVMVEPTEPTSSQPTATAGEVSDAGTTTGGSGAGFGVGLAVVALCGSLWLATRR